MAIKLRPAVIVNVAIAFAAALLIACDIQPSSTPQSLQTPRPVPEHMTVDDAIELLRDAGLTVEILDGDSGSTAFYWAHGLTQVSVNGYDRIGIAEYDRPRTHDELATTFHMHADFPSQNHPNPITVGNIVFLVQGVDIEAIPQVLTAVWDMAPPAEMTPFGVGTYSFDYRINDTEENIAAWLESRDETKGLSPTGQKTALTTMQGFADLWGFDALVDNMPHPDSHVWVTAFQKPGEDFFVTVASELVSGIPVAEVRTRQDLDALQPVEPPQILQASATDGAAGEYDELHTVVGWKSDFELFSPDGSWAETIDSFVIERSPHEEENWKPVAWVSDSGRDLTKDRPAAFVVPGGRLTVDVEQVEAERATFSVPIIHYWDYDVEQGVAYDYRIYGCTDFGRQTAYSEVVSAVAGDPDPSTPDTAAHVRSNVPEIDCAVERD